LFFTSSLVFCFRQCSAFRKEAKKEIEQINPADGLQPPLIYDVRPRVPKLPPNLKQEPSLGSCQVRQPTRNPFNSWLRHRLQSNLGCRLDFCGGHKASNEIVIHGTRQVN